MEVEPLIVGFHGAGARDLSICTVALALMMIIELVATFSTGGHAR
jgi:hypothetical protein